MTSLDLENSNLTKIENLPNNLQEFSCNYNTITKIENLPNSLQKFYCWSNQITKIKNLPDNLQEFSCSSNPISVIENLPNTLQEFYCSNNQITKIKNLPPGLKTFDYSGNPIKFVDNIDISWFEERGGFNLSWCNRIKHLQIRIRLHYKRNKSAHIIQNGCHNWLYKPYCRDGTIGLVPILGMKRRGIN